MRQLAGRLQEVQVQGGSCQGPPGQGQDGRCVVHVFGKEK